MIPYIIAEIGINHNGQFDLAERLIQEAKACGADAVKFQMRTIEDVYTPEELAQPRESPFGLTNGALKYGLEFSVEDYTKIQECCTFYQLDWSASVWDVRSVDRLMEFNPPWIKIPSALITNEALVRKVGETGKLVMWSTGMSTWEEVMDAERQLNLCGVPQIIMAATSTYPCPIEELNLTFIRNLQIYWQEHRIGFSSHSVSPWPCLMAACLGAEVIEAHFTLDRTMFGSDQSASLEPAAFKKMVTEIRTFEKAKGDGIKKVYDSELPIKAKLRR